MRARSPIPALQTLPPALLATPTTAVLVAAFVNYLAHSARRSSWVFTLPNLAGDTTSSTLPLRTALNAVSLAHFALVRNDVFLQMQASCEYGDALALQRRVIGAIQPPSEGLSSSRTVVLWPVKNALLASTILSYYELIAAVNPTAWAHHTQACEDLLRLMGPEIVSKDVLLRQLATSIRSHAVLRAVLYGFDTIFVQEEWIIAARYWTKMQKQSIPRDAYDFVIEFMLRASRAERATGAKTVANSKQSVDTPASLLNELLSNYSDFLLGRTPPLFATTLPLFSNVEWPAGSAITPELPVGLQTQFGSMAFAHFHAAALILAYHYPKELDKQCPNIEKSYNVKWITTVGRRLEVDSKTNATCVLRMGLLFSIVWRYCGIEAGESRREARTVFEGWCDKEGMRGLPVIGFENHNT